MYSMISNLFLYASDWDLISSKAMLMIAIIMLIRIMLTVTALKTNWNNQSNELTWESKENPCCPFICRPESSKVELSDGHGQGVLDGVVDVQEIPKVCAEDEEEEAAEWAKDDDKLNNEGGETDEAEFDCCSNLLEGFLEAEKPTELEHAGEDGEGDGVVVVGVDLHRLLNRDEGIPTGPLDLFCQLDHF